MQRQPGVSVSSESLFIICSIFLLPNSYTWGTSKRGINATSQTNSFWQAYILLVLIFTEGSYIKVNKSFSFFVFLSCRYNKEGEESFSASVPNPFPELPSSTLSPLLSECLWTKRSATQVSV